MESWNKITRWILLGIGISLFPLGFYLKWALHIPAGESLVRLAILLLWTVYYMPTLLQSGNRKKIASGFVGNLISAVLILLGGLFSLNADQSGATVLWNCGLGSAIFTWVITKWNSPAV